jgi:hypothetical protein
MVVYSGNEMAAATLVVRLAKPGERSNANFALRVRSPDQVRPERGVKKAA